MTTKNNVYNISDLLFFMLLVFAELVSTDSMKHSLALEPQSVPSLWNVFTAPLMHSGWEHLFNNLISLIVLVFVLRAFWKRMANVVFIASYVLPGIFTWFIAKPSFHLGASGIVYGLGSFIILSAILRRERQLAVVALVLVLFNGSAVWGLLPVKQGVSWQYHLGGAVTGVLIAVVDRILSSNKPAEATVGDKLSFSITADGVSIEYFYKQTDAKNNSD